MKDNIIQYAKTIFDQPEELDTFLHYISSTPVILGMMYIPLNSAIVVDVYKENRLGIKPIPTTLTQLYNDLTVILLQRYTLGVQLDTACNPSPQAVTDFPSEIQKRFLALAWKAFEGIITQQLVFTKLPESSMALGFTTPSAELYTGRNLSYSFLHLTLQEYLTAFSISLLPPEEQREIYIQLHSVCHLQVVWCFVAGLTGFKSIGWDVIKAASEQEGTRLWPNQVSLFLLRCLYEVHNPDACVHVLGTKQLSLRGMMMNTAPLDSYILGYCIACSQCTWDLGFVMMTDGPDHVRMLALGLNSLPAELPLAKIHILECKLCSESLSHLSQAILPYSASTLKQFAIINNAIARGEAAQLMRALLNAKKLDVFILTGADLGPNDLTALKRLIAPTTGNVKTPRISGRYQHPESRSQEDAALMEQMFTILFDNTSLEDLHLTNTFCNLNTPSNRPAMLLQNNSNLIHLSFHLCRIGGSSSAIRLAAALCKNTAIKTLRLEAAEFEILFKIPCGGVEGADPLGALALAGTLIANKTLEKVEVYDLSIGKSGAMALVQAVKYNQTLTQLTLRKQYKKQEIFLLPGSRSSCTVVINTHTQICNCLCSWD